jgi:hypothetical protein
LLADIKLLIYILYPVADKTRSADNQPTDAKREVEISKPTGRNKLQINRGGGFPFEAKQAYATGTDSNYSQFRQDISDLDVGKKTFLGIGR